MRSNQLRTCAARAGLSLGLLAAPVQAQSTQLWEGPADAPQSVVTGWFDGRNWSNFTTPSAGDSAILGWDTAFNTDPPTYIHLGDFQSTSGGPVVQGGPVQLANLWIESGDFVFDSGPFNVPGGNAGSLEGAFLGLGQNVTSTGTPGNATLRLVDTAAQFEIAGIGAQPGTSGALALEGVATSLVLSNHIVAGNEGTGNIALGAGASITSPWLHLAEFGQAVGDVSIESGSEITLSDHLNVGVRGQGAIDIRSGAALMNNGWTRAGDWATGHGTVLVTGAGSLMSTRWMDVGALGTGSLDVLQGATWQSSEFLTVAAFPGSTGDTYVSDGSTLTVGTGLLIGREGTGSLTADDGSTVQAELCFIGDSGSGVGALAIAGAGTSLIVADDDPNFPSGEISIGRGAQGSLHLSNGAQATARYLNAGAFSGGDGLIVLSGQGTALHVIDNRSVNPSAEFSIGRDGRAVCEILSGAVVTARFGNVGVFNGGEGHLLISGSGSRCEVAESFTVGAPGENGAGLGSIEAANNGEMVIGGGLWLGNGSNVQVDATAGITSGNVQPQAGKVAIGSGGGLLGVGAIQGDVLIENGYVAPGYPMGIIGVSGDIDWAGGLLDVEIGDDNDRLSVSGQAQLSGTLRVSSLADVQPGDEFVVLSATQISGQFDQFIDTTPHSLSLTYTNTTVTIVAAADETCADVSGDGLVGLDDLALLLAAFGAGPGAADWNANADLNLDGSVNLTDLAILISQFGALC